MKRLTIILGILAASSAGAQVLQPIVPAKRADAGDKRIERKAVDLNTIAPAYHHSPTAPVSGRLVTPGSVATPRHPTAVLSQPTRSTPVRAQQNFRAKRIAGAGQVMPQAVQTTPAAPITGRVIYATTPAGQDELKRQLNRRK